MSNQPYSVISVFVKGAGLMLAIGNNGKHMPEIRFYPQSMKDDAQKLADLLNSAFQAGVARESLRRDFPTLSAFCA